MSVIRRRWNPDGLNAGLLVGLLSRRYFAVRCGFRANSAGKARDTRDNIFVAAFRKMDKWSRTPHITFVSGRCMYAARGIWKETKMAWKTPKSVEVPVGMEINMDACAARK